MLHPNSKNGGKVDLDRDMGCFLCGNCVRKSINLGERLIERGERLIRRVNWLIELGKRLINTNYGCYKLKIG
jgi:hypothetical protein